LQQLLLRRPDDVVLQTLGRHEHDLGADDIPMVTYISALYLPARGAAPWTIGLCMGFSSACDQPPPPPRRIAKISRDRTLRIRHRIYEMEY
jgi:hypothetical protein